MTDPQPANEWADPTRPTPTWSVPTSAPASSSTPTDPSAHEPPTQYAYQSPPSQDPYQVYATQPAYPVQPAYQPQPAYAGQYAQPQYVLTRPTNAMAIASLVCSLAGLAIFISAPVGAILGHIARRQIQQTGEQGDGMALAGIIVGWVLTGLGVLCCGGYLVFILGMFGLAGAGAAAGT